MLALALSSTRKAKRLISVSALNSVQVSIKQCSSIHSDQNLMVWSLVGIRFSGPVLDLLACSQQMLLLEELGSRVEQLGCLRGAVLTARLSNPTAS